MARNTHCTASPMHCLIAFKHLRACTILLLSALFLNVYGETLDTQDSSVALIQYTEPSIALSDSILEMRTTTIVLRSGCSINESQWQLHNRRKIEDEKALLLKKLGKPASS